MSQQNDVFRLESGCAYFPTNHPQRRCMIPPSNVSADTNREKAMGCFEATSGRLGRSFQTNHVSMQICQGFKYVLFSPLFGKDSHFD